MKALSIVSSDAERMIMASLPDIDSDVPTSYKELCIDYLRDKYGKDRISKIGTIGSYQYKSVLKDLLKINGATPARAEYITKKFESDPDSTWETVVYEMFSNSEIRKEMEPYHQVIEDMESIMGSSRQVGIHACGLVQTPSYFNSISEIVPVRKTPDGIVTDFESSELEAIGLVKMDILGLSELDLYGDIIKNLNKDGIDIDIYNLDENDKDTYNTFCEGRTTNIFQFGGSLKSYSKILKPENMDDLAAANSLVRPGPLENGWHMDYAKRRNGREEVSYIEGLEKITEKTYGLIVYQEQVMQTFVLLAGFSMSEADSVRKAMGKKDHDLLSSYKDKFIKGAVERGYSNSFAENLFSQLESFASYSFNKCLAGSEKIKGIGFSLNKQNPSIEEMYRIKNDFDYAKSVKKQSLHKKYKSKGYGTCLSLSEDGKLKRNRIIDIRFEGFRGVFKLKTESGKTIRTTSNHKFPTKCGEKVLSNIKVNVDRIPVKVGFGIKWETVSSIILDGYENVYDVEVNGGVSHTFVTEGDIVTCNSHAISYSKTAYCGSYLKTNYPLQFWTTSLDLIKDTKDIPVYIDEIIADNNITLNSPDIKMSSDKFTFDIKTNSIFWSFTQIKQIGNANISVVMDDRNKNGNYYSLSEFLDRCPADKRVIEHLIICGAFDDVEMLESPKERKRLVEQFRKERGVKLTGEKIKTDWFTNNLSEMGNDFWWLIKQKELCGYSIIKYPEIIEKNYADTFDIFKYKSVGKILEMPRLINITNVVTAGVVGDVKVKKINGKDMMSFNVEENYRKISVVVWNKELEKFKDILLHMDKKIAIFAAEILWDNWRQCNSLRFFSGTEIKII